RMTVLTPLAFAWSIRLRRVSWEYSSTMPLSMTTAAGAGWLVADWVDAGAVDCAGRAAAPLAMTRAANARHTISRRLGAAMMYLILRCVPAKPKAKPL